ncbi:MAG TPA: DUF3052 family protein [Steroidobacteraceae bacterium]|nr:DUF3052 family protein [Steroidobacteraceae bacterium]
MPGYSGTPLAKKLGIKPGCRIHPLNAPSDYRKLLEPLPNEVRFESDVNAATDIVHVFETQRDRLAMTLVELRRQLSADAAIWVSWPKKSSRVVTTITEDTIRTLALPLGVVDVKVCAVTDVWSGLKLVVRKSLR